MYILTYLLLFRPRHSIETLEAAIQEVDSIPAYLPSCLQLKDCVSRAREWIMEADGLQVRFPCFCSALLFKTL